MAKNRITRPDIVDDKVLTIGTDYAKDLQLAVKANEAWLKSFIPIKNAALENLNFEKEFKASNGRKEFLELKKKEVELQEKTAKALKAEQALLLQAEAIQNKVLQNKAKEIDVNTKLLNLSNKEEATLKRKTKLSAQERVELQQRTAEAKKLALISSSLSTAYEKESARLILLTRRYKGVAVEYGVNSAQAKKLRTELDVLRNKLFEVDKAAGNFQRNVGNYPRSFGGAIGSIKQLASAAGLLGGAFLAVQVARDATRTIIDFDRQLIAVRKTTNFTKEETALYAREVVNLGLSLKGISIQNLLKASELAGQLGVKGSANIQKFAATIEKLKLTSDISSDESALDFAKFIEVSSDDFENADRLGSVITELGNNFAATESQILSNTTEIQKGISIYDASAQSVIGLGAATSALGNEAESSRSALQTTFKVLNDGASSGKNLDKILKLTRQTAAEFKKEFATDSVETFRKFVLGLSNSQKEGKNLSNTLSDLGIKEKRALTVVGSLSKNYNILEDALNKANVEYENNVALEKESELFAESLSSTISDLGDSWDSLVLSIENGDGALSKGFKSVVGFLNDVVSGIRLLNLTQAEYNESLKNDVTNETYKEVTKALKEGGEAAKELAIQDADNARDKVEALQKEIDLIKTRNEEIKKESESGFGALGAGFRKSSALILPGIVSSENPEIAENDKKITELSASLGFYNGVLKASEELITQTDDALSKKTLTVDEEIELTEKQRKAEEKANKERERANEALLRRRQLEKDNQFKLDSFYLNEIINQQKTVSDNEDNAFADRLSALEEQAKAELELAKRTAENKFSLEKGFTSEDIEALLDGGEASKEALRKIGDEELQIIAEYQSRKNEIQSGEDESIVKLNVNRLKNEADIAKSIQEKQLNDELALENDLFLKKEGLYANEEKAVENREKRIADIKRKYALEGLNAQVLALEELINQSEEGSKKRIEAEEKLSAARLAISNLTTEKYIQDQEKEVEAVKLSTQDILAISQDLAFAIGDLTSAILDGKIQKIDEEIEANDKKYERLLENELISEKEKKAIQDRQEADRAALEKKKREEQRKQAIIAKITTGLSITLSTIAASIAALEPPPTGLGPVAGIPLAVATSAIGAIQLAAALAAPIPKYAKGTDNHPGGFAEVGEGKNKGKYVPEIVKEPGRTPYLVTKPTILDLPKHTKVTPVTPSLDEYEKIMRASILASVDIDNKKLNSFQAKVSVNNNYDVLVREMQLTREEIKKSKNPIHFHEREIDIDHAVWSSKNRRWHG